MEPNEGSSRPSYAERAKKKPGPIRKISMKEVPQEILDFVRKIPPKQPQIQHIFPKSEQKTSSPGEWSRPQSPESRVYFEFRNYRENDSLKAVLKKEIEECVQDIVKNHPPAPIVPDDYSDTSPVCPLSFTPITCPCRGESCNHQQCFDLRHFLIACDEIGWACPVCGITLNYESLRVDYQFLFSILRNSFYSYRRANLWQEQLIDQPIYEEQPNFFD